MTSFANFIDQGSVCGHSMSIFALEVTGKTYEIYVQKTVNVKCSRKHEAFSFTSFV